jgi:hypothetical protein
MLHRWHSTMIPGDFALAGNVDTVTAAGQSHGQIGYEQTVLLMRRLDYPDSMVAQSDMNNPTTQSAITAAVIQPTIFSQSDKVKRPITRGLLAKFIITAMIGATITPLMTALQ